MSTKPETQVEGAALIDLIVRDVCETDPADHDKPDTLFIKVSDLRAILESRLEEAALLAADGKAGGEVVAYLLIPHDDPMGELPKQLVFATRYTPRPDLHKAEIALGYTRPQQAAQVAQPLTKEGGHED